MKFRFSISVTDQDYLDFNKFVMFHTPYGKKQMRMLRIMYAVIGLLGMIVSLMLQGISFFSVFTVLFWIGILVALQLILKPLQNWALKSNIKRLKKSGKMPYSPQATVEFYDDYVIDDDGCAKAQRTYASFERVSVVPGKAVYLHINSLMGYMIPYATFESEEQYGEFLEFIKEKIATVNCY